MSLALWFVAAIYVIAVDWAEINAVLTLGLIAATFAAVYARRQIDTQRETSEQALRTQVKRSEEALAAQLTTATDALDAAREMSAEELTATRAAAEAAEAAVQRQIEATGRPAQPRRWCFYSFVSSSHDRARSIVAIRTRPIRPDDAFNGGY